MAKERKRHRTDQEKEQLIIGFEAQSPDLGKAWLKRQGVNHSWFYKMRQQYMATHPGWSPESPAQDPQPGATSFADLQDTEKRRLLAEYEAIPSERGGPRREPGEPSARQVWLDAHGIKGPVLHYYKNRLKSSHPSTALALNGTPKRHPPKSPTPTVLPSIQHILSVDDMINAFKVERDMLNEVIAKMERMRASN